MKITRDSLQQVCDRLQMQNEELHLWKESDGSFGCAIKLKNSDSPLVQTLKLELAKLGIGHIVIETTDSPRGGGSYH